MKKGWKWCVVPSAENEHFELSLIEMNEDGYTYTYRTLERMQQERKDADYYFIIGADSLYNFETWMEPARICQAAGLWSRHAIIQKKKVWTVKCIVYLSNTTAHS